MCENLSKVIYLTAIILHAAEGLYINPVYDDFNRNKRSHTTVCVQIQPNGAESHVPYFMCKGPEFSPNQMPPNFVHPTGGNYANFNQQRAVQDTAEFSKTNGENNQHIYPPQTLQFGNSYQQNAQFPQNEQKSFGDVKIPLVGHNPGVHQNPEIHQHSEVYHNPSNMPADYRVHQNTEIHQHPEVYHNPSNIPADYGSFHYNAAPSMSFHSDYATANPRNINENIPQTSSDFSKTNIPLDSKTNHEREIGNDTSHAQPLSPETAKHNIDPEQYRTLLEDEVLGVPNLGFSHDEVLPIQNIYSETKNPLTLQAQQIPPEYFDDPILRTFYNIDHHYAAGPIEPTYLPPAVAENKPVLQEHLLPLKNINACSNTRIPPISAMWMPPTAITKKCFDYPFTFQPILIAVPLLNSPYQDVLNHKHPVSCEQNQNMQVDPIHYHMQSNLNKGSYRSQSGDTVAEDLFNKKSSTITEIKTDQQDQTNSTIASESSEEELFVEDITTKADKAVSKNDDDSSSEDTKNIKEENSTTSTPQTTVKTFRTILNAAKTHVMRNHNLNARDMQQSVNKRHIPYINSGVYPVDLKRQHVRKLENNYDH